MTDTVARYILGLHGWVALAVVFAVPLLESSTFLGFLFPGEIAVLLGGVLAFHHRIDLAAVLAAAVSGAILGDSAGYAVGRRFGRRLLEGAFGRFLRRKHLDRAERYLAQRGGKAVFFGRFTAALRVLIPGLAGMARMPYRTFVFYNVTGGAIWATGMALIGYLAGASWQRAAHLATRVGLVALALLALGFSLTLLARSMRRHSERLHALGDRLAAIPPAAWIRRRFPAQLAWLRRRLDPTAPDGLALTVTLVLAGLCAWTFAGLTRDVLAKEDLVALDPRIHAFVVAHRTGWLTLIMRNVTWLGSSFVLVPLLVIVTAVLIRGRDRRTRGLRAARQLWAAFLGGVVLYTLAKQLVGRPRPPATELIGQASGPAYPSGHATQAIVTWGMLAVVLTAGRSGRVRRWLLSAAVVVVLLVGASRVYLGAHWLTDVLGGYALGGAWLALILALYLRHGTDQPAPRPGPPTGTPPDRDGSDRDGGRASIPARSVRPQPGPGRHGHFAISYPASSTAAATAASSSGAALVTVTAPVGRSTCTSVTPSSCSSSEVTALTQCPQVIPETV
jgi:membrane protein DedA with SNARE-associated domain/membrane-associated phospholipid phosphatase